jgi:ribosomal protein S12 methylthiotransferase accessory factor YcaO
MSRFRVTLRRASVEIVTADNPFQAAVVVAELFGDGVEVADVRPAVGRPTSNAAKVAAKKTVKEVAKKRRPLSPEARAKLAQNLVKARAARARNVKAGKKATKKRPAKKKAVKRG